MWSERRLYPGQAEKLDKRNILSQKKYFWSGEEEIFNRPGVAGAVLQTAL